MEAQLKALMLAGLAGNSEAHSLLLEAAARRLKGYFARRLGHDCADLEDLVQDTLIAIHRRRGSYDRALPFTAWLHTIARYKLIDHLRKRGVRKHVPLDDADALVAADQCEASLASIDVARLLDGLPEKHRVSIMLTRIEGHSVAEAAAMTSQSASGVKINVHRGIKRLISRVGGSDDRD